MIAQTLNREKLLIEPVNIFPSVFILFPFDPNMTSKPDMEQKVKEILKKTEFQLNQKFPRYTSERILAVVETLTKSLLFSDSFKSIAILVYANNQTLYYLDFPVEEMIVLGEPIEIKNILRYKKPEKKYLLLTLSSKQAKIYLGNGEQLTRIVHNLPRHIAAYKNDIPEKVANFSDPHYRKEVMLKKFIQHVDDGLSILINAYHLPVILMCTSKTKGYFSSISKNTDQIVEFIHGNFDRFTIARLTEKLQPYLNSWDKISDADNLLRLKKALKKNKASTSLSNVLEAAHEKKGKLLLLERRSLFPESANKSIENVFKPGNYPTFCRMAINELIQEVLENGGTVDLLSDDMLKDYGHIAMINYY